MRISIFSYRAPSLVSCPCIGSNSNNKATPKISLPTSFLHTRLLPNSTPDCSISIQSWDQTNQVSFYWVFHAQFVSSHSWLQVNMLHRKLLTSRAPSLGLAGFYYTQTLSEWGFHLYHWHSFTVPSSHSRLSKEKTPCKNKSGKLNTKIISFLRYSHFILIKGI